MRCGLATSGGTAASALDASRRGWLSSSFSLFLLKQLRFRMRHVLSAVVQNVPGVFAHISGMLASRGYNINSLAVGETETPNFSRMTFVVVGDDHVLEQVRRQLGKIVTVVKVTTSALTATSNAT